MQLSRSGTAVSSHVERAASKSQAVVVVKTPNSQRHPVVCMQQQPVNSNGKQHQNRCVADICEQH
jgi:hypothetical protein